jgi:hypothetical protein
MNMLVHLHGRERSALEYEQLLQGAGLRVKSVIRTPSPYTVIEALAG